VIGDCPRRSDRALQDFAHIGTRQDCLCNLCDREGAGLVKGNPGRQRGFRLDEGATHWCRNGGAVIAIA